MKRHHELSLLLAVLVLGSWMSPTIGQAPKTEPPFRAVDLKVGEKRKVDLVGGSTATVKLLDLKEVRDDARQAVREARVTVEVNGEKRVLVSATYHLPVTLGGVQIDCPVTKGCVQPKENPWALDADVRLRLWRAGSPWIQPGTFAYPAGQRWFASDTQMSNEPTFVDGGEDPKRKQIYYHWGLDLGGAEGMVPVLSATDGLAVTVGKQVLESEREGTPCTPRYDVIYIKDARGWYYRYSHLFAIDPSVKLGQPVKMGQKIGILGKEGGSGGWSHLHFDISALQPSGRYGIVEGYAFLWQAYRAEHGPEPQAVARPHHLIWSGGCVTLDATSSWSSQGPGGIARYDWTFCDGTKATSPKVQRRYEKPGRYCEALKITDYEGQIDYDFAAVLVLDRKQPDVLPPAIHAVYWPTLGIKPGDEITFKVRSFAIGPKEGREVWDFGDGSAPVAVQSDGCVESLAKDGYAVTTHRYAEPGNYLVRVERRTDRGVPAIARLKVRVGK
jgi:murein DD-endopeptidase MepM/ murein hydrolase activator NlpD